MKKFLQFFTDSSFWLNLALAVLLVVGLVWGTFRYLGIYTLHGKSIEVPDLHELSLEQAQDTLQKRHLEASVVDSVYSNEEPRGAVVTQKPHPFSRVKKDRTIFLTLNSQLAEMVQIPDLEGKSLRIALSLMKVKGIKTNELKYQPDETCTDCVLKMLYKGEEATPGQQIRKGDKLTLVLGKKTNARVEVPDLAGMNLEEARKKLKKQSLNFGGVLRCNHCATAEDTARATVYIQSPTPQESNYVSMGSQVDVYLTLDSTQTANKN